MVELMGYNAAAQEIKNNRNALKNMIFVVNDFCKKVLSEKYNPETREIVWRPSGKKIKEVEAFKNEITAIAKAYLRDNTEIEKEYLELKNKYGNLMFQYAVLTEKN